MAEDNSTQSDDEDRLASDAQDTDEESSTAEGGVWRERARRAARRFRRGGREGDEVEADAWFPPLASAAKSRLLDALDRKPPTDPALDADVNIKDDFHNLSKAVLGRAMETARQLLLDGEKPIDAEDLGPADFFASQIELFLAALEGKERPPGNVVGDPPIQADRDTHRAVADFLEAHFDGCYLIGEEANRDAWDAMLSAAPGSTVFVLDAIDGSKPYENLTFGYGATLLMLRRTAERDVLEGAAICNSSGLYVSMNAIGGVGADVVAGYLGDGFEVPPVEVTLFSDSALASMSRNDAVAVVGATPAQRRRAARLLTPGGSFFDTTVYNLGGAPAAVGLMLGRLGALVSFKHQTIWDAAYLPILAALGYPVLLIDSRTFVGVAEVEAWFGRITRQRLSDSHSDEVRESLTPVPPFIAARQLDYANEILAGLELPD